MKRLIIASIALLIISMDGYTQDNSQFVNEKKEDTFKIIFENGFLIGNSDGQYPMPFSSHLSFFKKVKNFYFGAGSGAEVIGRTYIPLFADIRYLPFKSKPLYIYGKGGYNFSFSNDYKEEANANYKYDYWPYPVTTNYKWYGGIMAEAGFGILLKMKNWDSSISIGYRYQKTRYESTDDSNKRMYENFYNRLSLRIGFWF